MRTNNILKIEHPFLSFSLRNFTKNPAPRNFRTPRISLVDIAGLRHYPSISAIIPNVTLRRIALVDIPALTRNVNVTGLIGENHLGNFERPIPYRKFS